MTLSTYHAALIDAADLLCREAQFRSQALCEIEDQNSDEALMSVVEIQTLERAAEHILALVPAR